MRSPEGRAALGVSNPSCRLRGINGRQLARLSTVFLAFPEEDEQSVCAGRGASAAQRERPGSRLRGLCRAPGERNQTREWGGALLEQLLLGWAEVWRGLTLLDPRAKAVDCG